MKHCGEKTGSNWIRVVDGKHVCLDCFEEYDRFSGFDLTIDQSEDIEKVEAKIAAILKDKWNTEDKIC